MKLMKLYERVLIEDNSQSCLAKFGTDLFDPQLNIGGGEIEPNTGIENNYLKLINNFTDDEFGSKLNPKFVTAMQTLNSCMSKYPEVLQPEGTAYRGTNLSLSQLLDQYEDIADDLKKGGTFDFVYKPKSLIQSWSSEKGIAEDFSIVSRHLTDYIREYNEIKNNPKELAELMEELYTQKDDIVCSVVIALNTSSDDFLFKAEYFSELSFHEGEDELLRINNKPTKVTGEIFKTLLGPVYGILTGLRKYEAHLGQ